MNEVMSEVTVKVFTDAIDALEKLGKGVIALANLPRAKRERYQRAVSEAYKLINTAVNLVYIRFGDLLNQKKKADFLRDASALDNIVQWLDLERDVRLCSNLRSTHQEIDGIFTAGFTPSSRRNWEKTRELVDNLLEREGTLANFLSGKLKGLADAARDVRSDPEAYRSLRSDVRAARQAVDRERTRLLEAELHFIQAITGTGK